MKNKKTVKVTKAQEKSYVEHKGTKCLDPECLGDDLQGDAVEIDGGEAWQRVTCNECGWSWIDIYKLSGVSEITK